jgi:hypothetical protein
LHTEIIATNRSGQFINNEIYEDEDGAGDEEDDDGVGAAAAGQIEDF